MYFIIVHKEKSEYNKDIRLMKSNGIKIERYIPELETTLVRTNNPNILKHFKFIEEFYMLTKKQFDNFSVY